MGKQEKIMRIKNTVLDFGGVPNLPTETVDAELALVRDRSNFVYWPGQSVTEDTVYYLADPVVMRKGERWLGEGHGPNQAVLKWNTLEEDAVALTYPSWGSVSYLVLRGTRPNGSSGGNGVGLGDMQQPPAENSRTRSAVSQLHVTNFKYGLRMGYGWLNDFKGCIIRHNTVGVHLREAHPSNQSNSVTFHGGEIAGSKIGVHIESGLINVSFRNMAIEGNTMGVLVDGRGGTVPTHKEGLTFENVYFEANPDGAIVFQGPAVAIVSVINRNTFTNTGNPAIVLKPNMVGTVITNNIFRLNANSGPVDIALNGNTEVEIRNNWRFDPRDGTITPAEIR